MSSRRSTRAGNRRLSKAGVPSSTSSGAVAANDANTSGKAGTRQLSLPQMLLRHTERLSIVEVLESSASEVVGDEKNSAEAEKSRPSQIINDDNDKGDSNNRNLGSCDTNLSTGVDGESISKHAPLTKSSNASTNDSVAAKSVRRKRRASDSDPEERESLAGVKRRQTLATNTGWIPLAPKPEIVCQRLSAEGSLVTRGQATSSSVSVRSGSSSSSTLSVLTTNKMNSRRNRKSESETSVSHSRRSPKTMRRSSKTTSATITTSEDEGAVEKEELDFLGDDYPWNSGADVIPDVIHASETSSTIQRQIGNVKDENESPNSASPDSKRRTAASISVSVHDIHALPFISRPRDSTDSHQSVDSRRSSAESCFQFSADTSSSSSSNIPRSRRSSNSKRNSTTNSSIGKSTTADSSSTSCLLTTNSARLSQTTPVEQVAGVAEAPEFVPVERPPVKELPKTYAPLPFQLDEKVKEFQFPVNRLWKSPLPVLSWANPEEVWLVMLQKEQMYLRDADILQKHPSLQARMRSILLDWLTEVCEVYKLHRETFYLAVDFVDRYLTQKENIPKQRLQLIGITALFIASKIEEIYPPKLMEFAYVTDGACTEDQILTQELLILKALSWDLSPITVNGWLNIFMQLTNVENIEDSKEKFVFPQYSGHAFSQIAQLLDLVIMDIGCLKFGHNLVATAAIHHMASEPLALSVSGLRHDDIAECVEWMVPFADVLREIGTMPARHFPDIPDDDQHNIQVHSVDLSMLDAAQSRQEEARVQKEKARAVTPVQKLQEKGELAPAVSPKPSRKNESFLTPPMSSQKHVKRT